VIISTFYTKKLIEILMPDYCQQTLEMYELYSVRIAVAAFALA